jgi:hypothetical protein
MSFRKALSRTLFSFSLVALTGAASAQSQDPHALEDVPDAWFGQSDTQSIGLTSETEWRLALRTTRSLDNTAAQSDEPGYSIAAFPRIDPERRDSFDDLKEMTPAVPWDLDAPDYDYRTEATWFADWYGDADLEG